jgi:hypothetical protein
MEGSPNAAGRVCNNCGQSNLSSGDYCRQCGKPLNYYRAPYVDNYLVWAVLATIIGCMPLGIVSLIYSSRSGTKLSIGDVEGSKRDAAEAKKWAIISGCVQGAFIFFFVIFYAAFIFIILRHGFTAPGLGPND